jgi:hypothetical protein
MVQRAGFLSVLMLVLLAPAAHAGVRVELRVSGALTVSWHGDQARGCADAGACDLAGAVTLAPESGGDQVSESSGGSVLDLLQTTIEDATVRVVRGPAEHPLGVCLDTVGPVELSLGSGRAPNGRVRLLIAGFGLPFSGPLPANRCAGPLGSDITPALPVISARARDLRKPDVKLDFTGRRPFAGGAFSGEITSTLVLRAHVTHPPLRSRRISRPTPVRGGSERVGLLDLSYRVTPGPEPLTTAFRAVGSPRCEVLDVCGLSGATAVTLSKPMRLAIRATWPLRGKRPTLAAALAAVRAGRGTLFAGTDEERPTGRSATEVARDGAPACRDARTAALPELNGERHGKRFVVALGGAHFGDAEDVLRSRCPGPARTPERDGALAAGAIGLTQLGARHLTVRLAGRPIHDPDFVTTPGALTLELERTAQRVTAAGVA